MTTVNYPSAREIHDSGVMVGFWAEMNDRNNVMTYDESIETAQYKGLTMEPAAVGIRILTSPYFAKGLEEGRKTGTFAATVAGLNK